MSDAIVAFLQWQHRNEQGEQALARLNDLKMGIEILESAVRSFVGSPPPHPPILLTPIDALGLNRLTVSKLHEVGIRNLGDLIQFTSVKLLRETRLGRAPMFEIKNVLKEKGLELGAKLENWPPPDLPKD